jgi:leader peptidase (prepilin peptidase) / N-methyltransferase
MTAPDTQESPVFGVKRSIVMAVVCAIYLLLAAPIFILDGPPIPPATLLGTAVLAATLIALSVIDFEEFRLPDILTLPLAATGIGLTAIFGWNDPVVHIVGTFAGFLTLFSAGWLYERLRGRRGLGLGDAKLFAASGAWLGPSGLPGVLLYACAFGLAYAGLMKLVNGQVSLASALPFGPFLALGTWIVWIYGPLL